MFTLPDHTSLRIRKPTKALVALIATVMPHPYVKLTVAFSSFVPRRVGPQYAWYDLESGDIEHFVMPRSRREQRKVATEFEIEPGYALFDLHLRELDIRLSAFARTPDQAASLEIARDAYLDGRIAECQRIAKEGLRYGWPLFLAVIAKETNRGTS